MRKTHPAPVDTMGANSCHDESADKKVTYVCFYYMISKFLTSK